MGGIGAHPGSAVQTIQMAEQRVLLVIVECLIVSIEFLQQVFHPGFDQEFGPKFFRTVARQLKINLGSLEEHGGHKHDQDHQEKRQGNSHSSAVLKD